MYIKNKNEGSSQQQVQNSRKRKLSLTGFDDDVAHRTIQRYNSASQSSDVWNQSPQYLESLILSKRALKKKICANGQSQLLAFNMSSEQF